MRLVKLSIEVHTGKFVAKESLEDISVILMSDKINHSFN